MEAQRIIITGGATRIGAAIAEKLSGPNKQIVIQYHKSKSKAENLKKKLQNFGTKISRNKRTNQGRYLLCYNK